MKKMLQVVHMSNFSSLCLTSTKPKTPSTQTETEQPIRWAVKTVAFLPATVTRPRTPCLWNGTALELRYEHQVLDWYFSAMSCRPCRQRFLNREASRRSPGSWQDHPLFQVGGGLRLVGGSGNTYRFEISTGEEGAEMIVMFQYPWRGKCKLRNLLHCPAPDDLRCSILSLGIDRF